MPDNKPATNVSELLARVTQSTANVQKHRDAMANVAAQVATNNAQPQSKGGVKQ